MDGNAFEIWKNASIVHANLAPAFIHRLVGGIWRGGSMHVLLFSIHTKICFVKVDHSTAEYFPADVFQRGLHPRLARIEEVDQGAGLDGTRGHILKQLAGLFEADSAFRDQCCPQDLEF